MQNCPFEFFAHQTQPSINQTEAANKTLQIFSLKIELLLLKEEKNFIMYAFPWAELRKVIYM